MLWFEVLRGIEGAQDMFYVLIDKSFGFSVIMPQIWMVPEADLRRTTAAAMPTVLVISSALHSPAVIRRAVR